VEKAYERHANRRQRREEARFTDSSHSAGFS
jgi:hypothetical protein